MKSSRLSLIGVVIVSALVCSASATTPDPFLAANGVNIRNGHGSGDIVPLRGVNLGGWLVMEGWMCPMDSGSLSDNFTVVSTLDSRFGTNIEQSLIRTFQNNWIRTNDLDNIKAMGMNVVRVPVWWENFQTLAGAWRADAFDRLDWVVSNAWQRGIYTIIDMHGVVGGQSTAANTGRQNQNQYWSNSSFQSQTATIWSNIAVHFNGNPGVAAYDLINEPYGKPSNSTLWNMYNSLYQTIRLADPDHMIILEGGSNGLLDLPNPGAFGWSNVIYSAHEYQFASSGSPSGVETGIDNQVNRWNSHQFLNVPFYIGEFNCFSPGSDPVSVWEYAIQKFNTNNINWSSWAYKATHGSSGAQDSWGLYDPSGTFPPVPNIASDSSTSISNAWRLSPFVFPFGINAMLKRSLGAPLAVADSYTATSGVTLAVGSGPGVLANDLDINSNESGIQMTAVLVNGPANGQLTLNTDGSFSYTSTAGFTGTDTFRYRVYDGYVDSANIVTISIQVLPGTPPASSFQQWQVQYFGDTNAPNAGADADPDGDGESNLAEFQTGNDPTNSAAYFHVTSLAPGSNSVGVAWVCGPGRTNVLQATSTIGGTYSNVSPNIVLDGSGMTNYLDTGSFAAVNGGASDNASDPVYTGGNFNGANGGTGFGGWIINPPANTSTALWFITTSTTNGFNPTGGIDSPGNKSWGAFANNGAIAAAVRAFSSGALVTGQVFSLDMDNGYVESGNSVGFQLQNSSGQTLLEINYIGGNPGGSYGSIDLTGAHSLGVPYTDNGLHAQITLTSAMTYSASLTPAGGSTVNFGGTLINPSGGQGITQFRLFSANAAAGNTGSNWDVFWNNLSVTSVTNTVNTGAPNAPARFYRVLLVP